MGSKDVFIADNEFVQLLNAELNLWRDAIDACMTDFSFRIAFVISCRVGTTSSFNLVVVGCIWFLVLHSCKEHVKVFSSEFLDRLFNLVRRAIYFFHLIDTFIVISTEFSSLCMGWLTTCFMCHRGFFVWWKAAFFIWAEWLMWVDYLEKVLLDPPMVFIKPVMVFLYNKAKDVFWCLLYGRFYIVFKDVRKYLFDNC